MKKFLVTIFIFLLIFSIAFIKNSSKKIEDEIFFVKENLRGLKKELNNTGKCWIFGPSGVRQVKKKRKSS